MTLPREIQEAEREDSLNASQYDWEPAPAAPAPSALPTVQSMEPGLMPLCRETASRCGIPTGTPVTYDEFKLAIFVSTGMELTNRERRSRRWKDVRPHVWEILRKAQREKKLTK